MFRSMLPSGLALAGAFSSVKGSPVANRATAACSASNIPYPTLFGAQITGLTAETVTDYYGFLGSDVCQVNVTLTHPGTGDSVTNVVALPLSGWNGIFQGVGGGGFSAGIYEAQGPIAAGGYSCVSTDAGFPTGLLAEGFADNWALVSEGNVNQYLLLNFARQSYHDMTVIGKAVTQSFYGTAPKYSYWNGCSTGGRQGLVVAQYYPTDYSGILANAPAIQWNDCKPP